MAFSPLRVGPVGGGPVGVGPVGDFTPPTFVTRYLDLDHPIHVYTRSGYTLIARDLATSVETELGFIDAAGPLTLTGIALDDGEYEIRVELSGYYWRKCLFPSVWRVRVAAGVIAADPIPFVTALNYSWNPTQTTFAWTCLWDQQPGVAEPDDFAIWTGLTDPDTSLAPTYTVSASSPGAYSKVVAQGAADLYVTVCARVGAAKGPFAKIVIPAPPVTLDSPENQHVQTPA